MAVKTSPAKRKVIRAGRRSGKTVGVALLACEEFLAGQRVLYGTPTQDQMETFWFEVKRALAELIDAGIVYKNESLHIVEIPGTKQRIRAKTCWNAETLRGDYADLLILDEYQLMNEDTWELVGAPMLLDNDGDAIFIYTPPSLRSRTISKARDPRHAAKLFNFAQQDTTGRWEAFHFTSHDNPFIHGGALQEIAHDMTALAYRQEIMAEDVDEVPGALWTLAMIDDSRVDKAPERMARIVVGVDPPGGVTECGIIIAARQGDDYYILHDSSIQGSPNQWGVAVVNSYADYKADRVVAEKNFGGDMVMSTLGRVASDMDVDMPVRYVTASRGKAVRAEPVAALYERGKVHHVGEHPMLEEELCMWVPGDPHSPNRMDALVWAITDLMRGGQVAKALTGGQRDSLASRLGW